MKLAPMFSHFLDFHPHVDQHVASPKREHAPVLVFRGLPYKKEEATITAAVRPTANERLTFRGIPYTKVPGSAGLDLTRREKAVRIFRGIVVGQTA